MKEFSILRGIEGGIADTGLLAVVIWVGNLRCGWCLVLNLIILACLFLTSSSGRFPYSEVMRGERGRFGLKLVSGRWLICEE